MVDGLLHVLAVSLHRGKVGGQFGDAGDMLSITFRAKQVRTLSHAFVEIEFSADRWSTSRIEQQVLNNPRGSLNLSFDGLQTATYLGRKGEVFHEQLYMSRKSGQRRADFVRDCCGKLTDRRQPLCPGGGMLGCRQHLIAACERLIFCA